MDRRSLVGALLALPLVAGGVVLATTQAPGEKLQDRQATVNGYICPATGETLPCPKCCPLNK